MNRTEHLMIVCALYKNSPLLLLLLLLLFISRRVRPKSGGGPGAVVKSAYLESRRSRALTPFWPSSFKETNVSSPLTREDLNPVFGGQCHLIHLTILISWPSLVYMCTK